MNGQFSELVTPQALNTDTVPPEHQGACFERTIPGFIASPESCALERALAILWAERNTGGESLLMQLLAGDMETDPEGSEFYPINDHEERVAQFTAATVVQWLGNAVGRGFLQRAFQEAGFELTYTPTT